MLEEWTDFRNYTLKHYLVILTVVLLLGIALFFFLSSKKEAEVQAKKEKEAIVLVYSYADDIVRPVVEKELTIDELVEIIVSEQMGVSVKPTTFSKGTVRENLGIFVESGIIEGNNVPEISALSRELKENMTSGDSDEYMEKLYAAISKSKQKAIAEYRSNDVDETEILMEELKKRLAE